MSPASPAFKGVLFACTRADPALGLAGLVDCLAGALPDYRFHPVLTRAGWYRPGGVLGADGRVISEDLGSWLEDQVGDDLAGFVDRFQGDDLVATRIRGRTHYLTASTGEAPDEFIQLEVEELQVVADRLLLPEGWFPDDLEDLLDPLERHAVEPRPVGRSRYVFRRVQSVPDLLRGGHGMASVKRFMYDWAASSAGKTTHFSRRWVLALRETLGSDAEPYVSAKPVPALNPPDIGLADYAGQRGAALVDAIRAYDHAAGYPFAWFFSMLTSSRVSFAVGEAVLADLASDYDYLPPRDALILAGWANKRYAV